MKNYFTTIEKLNDNFFGTVTDNDTKQIVYRTVSHSSHANAIIDINNYLQNQNTVSSAGATNAVPQTITNTAVYTAPADHITPATQTKRCCGR